MSEDIQIGPLWGPATSDCTKIPGKGFRRQLPDGQWFHVLFPREIPQEEAEKWFEQMFEEAKVHPSLP